MRSLDAHPQVHRRIHAGALAGLWLRRKLEERAEAGRIDGKDITWGDTHHPAISETNGEYDGQFLFINDKANPRLAVIDLRDFETKQIVVNPIFKSEHGGAFVSSNTEYVIEAAQYASPLENKKFFPLEEFNEKYRGGVTYWKFDRKEGRIDTKKSFSLELPPTRRICPTSARVRPTVGRLPTRSAPSVMSAASRRVARRMRPAARRRTPTTCT
jgi:hypothetical protein